MGTVHSPSYTPEARPPRRTPPWFWLALLVLVAGVVWLFEARQTRAQAPPAAPGRSGRAMVVPVAVATAHLGNMPVYFDGLGTVTPYYTVTVHSRVDGQLMNLSYREGQYVAAGDLLVEIDPRPFQVQLAQAEGQMARDQALLANARLDLARYQTLIAKDAIPKQQLDTQASTVGQYEGAIKSDQAAIDNAKLQLTYCRITAPISGRIGLRLVDPGNMVHASDANGLLVITQMQPITVIFTLPEDELLPVVEKLRAGGNLNVDAYNRDKSRKLASGRLMTTDNQVDQSTGTLKLRAVFDNRDSALFPNQFVNVRLLVTVERNQVIVPAVAVQHGAQGNFVYLVKPDRTVEVRQVEGERTEGIVTSVSQGLRAGEIVVTDGADKLQPGTHVTVRTESGAPAGGRSGRPAAPRPAGGSGA